MSKVVAFLKDESGASAAEYAIIIAVVGAMLVVAMTTLGGALQTAATNAATMLTKTY